MAMIDLPRFAPHITVRTALASLANAFGTLDRLNDAGDGEDRDFILDAMQDCDAFRTEADVQCMMSVYPGRF